MKVVDVRAEFNEATRVQMPAMIHLTRIGYSYFGKLTQADAGVRYDPETNILLEVFRGQFELLNPDKLGLVDEVLRNIRRELDNDDLGKSFYNRLISSSPIQLVDFVNPERNLYHFTAEFTCKNGQDEFRPDITLFVNGIPLAFVEVKKPNNRGGVTAESERMNRVRFPNPKFRRFVNLAQIMVFSNNMEYDAAGGTVPIQGVFYCTASRGESRFSTFREENPKDLNVAPFHETFPYAKIDPALEERILTDFNAQVIRETPEYRLNLGEARPTNRVLTSLFSPDRFLFLLRYGIAYVRMDREVDGKIESVDQKHIMRYQQFFASLAVREKMNVGIKSGVIWHTQGSGKTALSYYLSKVLTDYYAVRNKVARFYFIVDRLDLLEQASQEFEARGLAVKTANTRQELMDQFRNGQSLEGPSGKPEVTVVNIQRFAEDKARVDLSAYATNLQRIFIVDEAHRGYNPKGSFLANLFESDKDAVKIALTGTPLLAHERSSWKIFGEYLHTYYYDKSIQDGYTLKVIREEIETSYRSRLSEIYDSVEHLVRKKDVPKTQIVEHDTYVKELLRFVITDFKQFRSLYSDDLGAMIIAESSQQARKLREYFDEVQSEVGFRDPTTPDLSVGLVLFDSDDKQGRTQTITNFKKNQGLDVLIVFNMLLTGFDAPRLKRLYLGRRLRDHNLLQALTRVNRPFHGMSHGFVVDFADIKENFDETNRAYLAELSRFTETQESSSETVGDAFVQIIEDPESMQLKAKQARQVLFNFDLQNAEHFSQQISATDDISGLYEIRNALRTLRETVNLVRSFGDNELKTKMAGLEIRKLPQLLTEVENAIAISNQKTTFAVSDATHRAINGMMAEIQFSFRANGAPEELKIASGLVDKVQIRWQRAIQAFATNIDKDDPEFVSLQEAFMQRFQERGFVFDSLEDAEEEIRELDEFYKKSYELNQKNEALLRTYSDDGKFVRVHKLLRNINRQRTELAKKPILSEFDDDISDFLRIIKSTVDDKIYHKGDILRKDTYFERTLLTVIAEACVRLGFTPEREDRLIISSNVSAQYLEQYRNYNLAG